MSRRGPDAVTTTTTATTSTTSRALTMAASSIEALAAAIAAALGPLVGDKDTSQIDLVEGGLPEVVRRGRRERLSALVEGPLFEIVREAGAATALVKAALPSGVHVVAGPLADGRVALSVRRAAPTDASLLHLVEEGVVPAGVDVELLAAVLVGHGLVVAGPARAARDRLAVAVAVAAAARVRVVAIGPDVPARAIPAPAADDVVARARAAVELGADVLFALDLSPTSLAALLTEPLAVPLVATTHVASMEGLMSRLGGLSRAAAGMVAVCGFDADGRPRLVELHGEAMASAAPTEASTPSSVTRGVSSSMPTTPTAAPAPLSPSISSTTPPPRAAPSSAYAPRLPPIEPAIDAPITLDALPAEWASEDIDDDPGWELGSLDASSSSSSPSPGSFDAALQAVAKRPTFAPKAPPLHPQAAALRGTGGLTLEPPLVRGGADVATDDDSSEGGDP
jgi:hypothetical protein